MMHTMDNMADKFIKDVREIVTELMKDPEKPVEGKVNNSIFPKSIISLWVIFCFCSH